MQTSPKVSADVQPMSPDLTRVNFPEWAQRLGRAGLRAEEQAVWKRCIITFLRDSKARGRVVCRANAREFWREQKERGRGADLTAFAAALDWFCGRGVRGEKWKVESGNGKRVAEGKMANCRWQMANGQMAEGREKEAGSGGAGAKHDPAGMADWAGGLLRGMRIGHYRERTWETYRHFGAAVREVCGWAGQAGRGGG